MTIHSHEINSHVDEESAKLMKLATWASVIVASLLIGVKFYAWVVTGSVSLMSSLVDSFLDVIVSLINLLAVRYALAPPDEEHRFGHTAAEDVAGLAQSAFIAGSAAFIAITAIQRMLHPEAIQHSELGIWVMVFSIIATAILVVFQKYVIHKTSSVVISADSLHYVGDLLMNLSIIAAFILYDKFAIQYADSVVALIIASYILYGAFEIGIGAFHKLLDREFDDGEREKIKQIVLAHEGALGMHNLKTRYSGIKPFIQFNLDLDGTQSLREAHEIADSLEHKLLEIYPGGEVIIHEDPVYPITDE